MSAAAVTVDWNQADVQRLHAVLRRVVEETPRLAHEAVDWATARFLISSRAGMHKGKARRRMRTHQSKGYQYYRVFTQRSRRPRIVMVPKSGDTDRLGRSREEVIRRFGKIRTAGAGKSSWNSAMRQHAIASGRSTVRPTNTDIIKARVSRTEHNRYQLRNTIESELSYLRKVWPNLSIVAIRKATNAMEAILNRQTAARYGEIWNGTK